MCCKKFRFRFRPRLINWFLSTCDLVHWRFHVTFLQPTVNDWLKHCNKSIHSKSKRKTTALHLLWIFLPYWVHSKSTTVRNLVKCSLHYTECQFTDICGMPCIVMPSSAERELEALLPLSPSFTEPSTSVNSNTKNPHFCELPCRLEAAEWQTGGKQGRGCAAASARDVTDTS